ncbi:carbamoyl phosphate synthase-like protein [Bhargavaea cecembensis DSE10]|uniref:Carbamoyl phosphate synthase-like protein n=1 Tax=Bhargavaea cecembensis DSE10 TaxID=1235279 RepID=M7NE38_9BACL|nr:ATP-grasp domain-containing protein [Bhargavaea cecembensis]EMR05456.1 carbamoyl phosphate synthase-like protein [Bhargavaea cecembensis DSE10]
MSKTESTIQFVPVVVGGNRGAYSLARAFYEAYGVKTNVISPMIIGPIENSKILKNYVQPEIDRPDRFFETIRQIDRDFPGIKKIIVGADDRYAEMLVRLQDRFPEQWVVPYVSKEVFGRATNKESFYEACEKAGVPYPKTLVITELEEKLPFAFPIVMKPADSPSYQALHFAGKEKVFFVKSEEEYRRIYRLMREGGYSEPIVLQEYVPGDDRSLAVVTAYTSPEDQEVKLIVFGQILLEDHTPSGIGNHLAILTRPEDSITEDVRKLIAETGFTGFSNFDLKYDKRTGRYVFFELNGRLGVSNYYVTAAGHNPATYYVDDRIRKLKLGTVVNKEEALFNVVPKSLLLKQIKSAQLRTKVKSLYREDRAFHPLEADFETNVKRKAVVWASTINYYRKFRKHPPKV